MTRRLMHALAALYALVAVSLLRYAVTSWENGSPYDAAVLFVATLLLTTAVIHHSYHRDELRAARTQLARAARPADPWSRVMRDDIALGWNDLESTCCLSAWESHGATHDPHHCTRTDQAA